MKLFTSLALAIGILALPTFASASDQKSAPEFCADFRDKIEFYAKQALGHDEYYERAKKKFSEETSNWRKTGKKDQALLDQINREAKDWWGWRDGSLTEANKFAPIYQALCKD